MELKLNFDIRELVDPVTYNSLGKERCLALFPLHVLQSLQALRVAFGRPIYCNTWHWGGARKFSGYRPLGCGVGREKGYHYKAMAFDLRGATSAETDILREFILKNGFSLGITRMERKKESPTWVHIDWADTGKNDIHVFIP